MSNLEIAKVLKPQGIKGEIKVESYTSNLSFLMSLKNFNIEEKTYNVLSIRIQDKYAYIKTKEINSIEEAEKLRNKILIVQKEETQEDDFEFFIQDLEDCRIEDEYGNLIGFIDSVEKYGSADIINIKLGGGTRSFPFLKSIFQNIDVKNKIIKVYKQKLEEVIVWR